MLATLLVTRLIIVAILCASALFTMGNMGSPGLSFMFMGLQGAVAFGPLCTALFLPRRVPRSFALGSMLVGPLLVLVAGIIMGRGNKAGAPISQDIS